MIDYLTEMAIQLGYEQMDLEVVADNTRAQALYQKCGFTETGRRARALMFDEKTLPTFIPPCTHRSGRAGAHAADMGREQ